MNINEDLLKVALLGVLYRLYITTHKHFGNEETSGYQLNKSTNVNVRELKGTFIKVEGVTGSYRPMVIGNGKLAQISV